VRQPACVSFGLPPCGANARSLRSPDSALIAQEKAARSGATAASSSAPASSGAVKEYTMEEVAKHNTEKDCWVVVNGQVLNVTKFLSEHPGAATRPELKSSFTLNNVCVPRAGGKQAILLFAGKEASEEFNMLHKVGRTACGGPP
jgi:hypothetical protein